MAVLIPEVPKDCPHSERHVYQRLGQELPGDWIVLHSLGLPGHETKIWGEADIVILSSLGVFALEVKGGTVTCREGVWRFAGDFKSYTKRESPWAQAMGSLGAIRQRLRQANPAFKKVLFGFGVVMPYTTCAVTGAEILQEVLLDKRKFRQPLKLYIHELERYWNAERLKKHGVSYRGLTAAELDGARQILRPDFNTALSLGSYLTGVESRLVMLTEEQIRASRRMTANPRTVVRGAAGTGKSVIAIERACQLSNAGYRVLYLCFNQLLAAHIRAALAGHNRATKIDVSHVHALYRNLIERSGYLPRLAGEDTESPDFFGRRFPELAAEAICERSYESWDVLIVDEAQDLLTPEHLDAFDLLLKQGLGGGRWHFFLDPQQNIYDVEVQAEVEERLSEVSPAFDDLFENCRNTRQVAVQASIVSGIDLAIDGAPDGPETEIHYYTTRDDAVHAIDSLLRQLIQRDVSPQDIAILSTRRLANSLLADVRQLAGRAVVDPSDEAAARAGSLLFTTIHAFKGLERQVVIALDMAEIGKPNWSMLHYAGLSRARCLLHIFLPASARPAYARQAKAYGRRIVTRPV